MNFVCRYLFMVCPYLTFNCVYQAISRILCTGTETDRVSWWELLVCYICYIDSAFTLYLYFLRERSFWRCDHIPVFWSSAWWFFLNKIIICHANKHGQLWCCLGPCGGRGLAAVCDKGGWGNAPFQHIIRGN